MKVKYLIIFFLIVCEFVNAQIPGTPVFMRSTPQVYTYSAAFSSVTSANITGQIFTNGQPIAETGVVWGTSPTLTIEPGTFSTTSINIFSGTPSATITGLSAGSIYYVALYAKTSSNVTLIGNSVEYEHGTVFSPLTGRKWLQWNLGATNYPPSSVDDVDNYGNLYQWGRGNDGSQYNASIITLPASNVYNPNGSTRPHVKAYNDYTNMGFPPYSKFVQNTVNNFIADWFLPSYDGLWQGVNGINNPCPSGYRVPTASEFSAEITALGISNKNDAFSSILKLTSKGYRWPTGPSITGSGTGYYWTSTVSNSNSNYTYASALRMGVGITINSTSSITKNLAYAVRCIQDDGNFNTSGGTAKVASYSCPSSGYSGSIYPLVSGTGGYSASNNATQTITANVTAAGTYSLTAYSNGITFAGNGTFAGTGSQTITLTATGTTKNVSGDYIIALQNVSPGCDFNAPVYNKSSGSDKDASNLGGSASITWYNVDQSGLTAEQLNENNRDLINGVESSTYSPSFKHYQRVNVTKIGSYNIESISNRYPGDGQTTLLTLGGSGTFTTTGIQTITLYYKGVSESSGHYFYLPYQQYIEPGKTLTTSQGVKIKNGQ